MVIVVVVIVVVVVGTGIGRSGEKIMTPLQIKRRRGTDG